MSKSRPAKGLSLIIYIVLHVEKLHFRRGYKRPSGHGFRYAEERGRKPAVILAGGYGVGGNAISEFF